jgi:hypothetical protein
LVSLSVVSAIISAALAVGVSLVRFRSVEPLFIRHSSIGAQAGAGLLVGIGFGLGAATLFLKASVFASGRAKAREVLQTAPLSRGDLVVMAMAAGVGEELLFRAALQPLVGLWFSSLLFTAVHYWVPLKGTARVVYGGFVFAVGIALGLLLEFAGLIAAMTAHAAVDLIILFAAHHHLRHIGGLV